MPSSASPAGLASLAYSLYISFIMVVYRDRVQLVPTTSEGKTINFSPLTLYHVKTPPFHFFLPLAVYYGADCFPLWWAWFSEYNALISVSMGKMLFGQQGNFVLQ